MTDHTGGFHPYPVYCHSCRKEIAPEFEFCPHCGADQRTRRLTEPASCAPMMLRSVDPPPPTSIQAVPAAFARVDYRYLPCPKCGRPVCNRGRGNPRKVTCEGCACGFIIDWRGNIPVVCPACGSTDASGGGVPIWLLALGFAGAILIDVLPTKYRCNACDCHFIGAPGANMVFGFFLR